MSSTDKAKQQGANDAGQNKGQQDPNSFKSDAERKAYQAAYEQEKKKNK